MPNRDKSNDAKTPYQYRLSPHAHHCLRMLATIKNVSMEQLLEDLILKEWGEAEKEMKDSFWKDMKKKGKK